MRTALTPTPEIRRCVPKVTLSMVHPAGAAAYVLRCLQDCWLRCFFNSFIGNASLGLRPMDRAPLLQAWEQSFASNEASDGGCAPVPHAAAPYPAVLPGG
eukprot:SAG11_NODE_2378_length_3435_cov_4.530576_2_plen_100_part_00